MMDLPNGQGTYCSAGNYFDKTGKYVELGCEYYGCCASRNCQSYMGQDPWSQTQCPKINTEQDCIDNEDVRLSCTWSGTQCTAFLNDVGQCASCKGDNDCNVGTFTSKCVQGVCQPETVNTCNEFQQGIVPITGTTYTRIPDGIPSGCTKLLNADPGVLNPCSGITNARECDSQKYQLVCQDKNNNPWYKRYIQCAFHT